MSYRSNIGFLVVAVPAVALACASGMTGPARTSAEAPVVLSISPASSATGVDPTAPLVVTFSHPMMAGMEALVVLHEGTISGPPVSGTPAWSSDRTRLTFTPTQPLKRATAYLLHLSPNLTDSSGQRIDFGACAQRVGGQVVARQHGRRDDGQWHDGRRLAAVVGDMGLWNELHVHDGLSGDWSASRPSSACARVTQSISRERRWPTPPIFAAGWIRVGTCWSSGGHRSGGRGVSARRPLSRGSLAKYSCRFAAGCGRRLGQRKPASGIAGGDSMLSSRPRCSRPTFGVLSAMT